MNEVFIPDKNKKVQYPSCFDELKSKKDAVRIGTILYMVFTGEIDVYSAKKLAGDYFLNRKNRNKKPMTGEDAWDYWANEYRLSRTLDWMFQISIEKDEDGSPDEHNECYEINPTLTRQHIERIRIGRRIYYGPGDLMGTLSFIEVKQAMICVEQFVTTREPEHLERLLAILYAQSPPYNRIMSLFNPFSDTIRAKFSERRVESAQKQLKKLPVGIKFWGFLFFVGCMNYIKDEPVLIDAGEYRLGCLFRSGGSSKDDTGLTGVLFTMAESGVFGSLEETSHASYFDVMLRLYQVHKQAEDLKSKFNK